jgi:alanine racemase
LDRNSQGSPREIALREGLRVWAEIDLDCLAFNVRSLNQRAGEARLLAVVKANAYGHGAIPVARTAIAAGAWGLGVISVEEGEELRRAGIDDPVLVLGSTSPAMAGRAVLHDLRTTVASLDIGRALSDAAQRHGKQAVVHVKVETGLNRYGLIPEKAAALAESLRALPNVVVEGLSTHLASVDEGDKTFTFQQYQLFCVCAERLPWIPIHHVASTGAVLDLPELCLAMARSGIGIYGYYPSEDVDHSISLRPVLSLRSRVGRVATVEAGESVGYGRTWVARRRSRIATVMAGYADGLRRSLSNEGVALVHGLPAPVAGRIAMDMQMLDVTDIPDVAAEDEVTFIGSQGAAFLSADEVAERAGTISYEILAGIMARVPRLFIRSGRIIAIQDLSGFREL